MNEGLIKILYKDSSIVAVEKPCRLLVHRTNISNDRIFLLQIVRDQISSRVYPVHRLDRAVSGVIVFAFTPEYARQLSIQFANGSIVKEYIVAVRGWTEAEGVIEHPLKTGLSGKLKKAVTFYSTLLCKEIPYQIGNFPTARISLVKVIPKTGRTNQIRRHFKHISHPVLGDTRYGDGRYNRLLRQIYNINDIMLTCRSLTLIHPEKNIPFTISSPLPERFKKLFGEEISSIIEKDR